MNFPSEYPSRILQDPSCLYSVIQSEAKDFGNIHRLNSFFVVSVSAILYCDVWLLLVPLLCIIKK